MKIPVLDKKGYGLFKYERSRGLARAGLFSLYSSLLVILPTPALISLGLLSDKVFPWLLGGGALFAGLGVLFVEAHLMRFGHKRPWVCHFAIFSIGVGGAALPLAGGLEVLGLSFPAMMLGWVTGLGFLGSVVALVVILLWGALDTSELVAKRLLALAD